MRHFRLSLFALLLLTTARPALAYQHDRAPGSFYFYDLTVDHEADNPKNDLSLSQAKIIECQGHAELFEWGKGGDCLRYTPEKIGDSISFRIHIAGVDKESPCSIETILANFNNEGIYQMLVNDLPTGPEHDCFGHDNWKQGQFSITPGDYKITYRYVGKNPKSSGSVLNIIWLNIS